MHVDELSLYHKQLPSQQESNLRRLLRGGPTGPDLWTLAREYEVSKSQRVARPRRVAAANTVAFIK
jgi:hypothetical protein